MDSGRMPSSVCHTGICTGHDKKDSVGRTGRRLQGLGDNSAMA